MRRLPEVREAKEVMNEALEWSTFRWLLEKPKVRATADRANAALDKLEKTVKARWSDEAKSISKSLSARSGSARHPHNEPLQPHIADFQLVQRIEAVLEADKAAKRARTDAEDTFDKAEKQMSVSLAREGCKKAIHSWELHEKAIRKAEAVINPAPTEEQVR
jgi:hypothetical protein